MVLAGLALLGASVRAEDGSLAFVAMGDWGWNGHSNQKVLSEAIAKEADALDIEFVVSLGDNFQVNGVRSVQDPLWRLSYEDIYTQPVMEKNWYVVLGNHDYHGNTQAEIDYTSVSRRWNLPSHWYAVKQKVTKDADLEMFFLDTSPFQSKYWAKRGAYPDLVRQDTAAQLRWIDSALASSTAKWKLVFGHHPLYSGGSKHGSETGDMQRLFAERFEKNGVTAYFSGHDHHMEHVVPKGSKVHYFVDGAHSVRAATAGPDSRFCKAVPGFATVQVGRDSLVVRFLDAQRKVLHRAAIGPRQP
jgi:tartrate-resistant acid phosphatase type 5